VIEFDQMRDLVCDDVSQHGFGREDQAPGKRQSCILRTAPPTAAGVANLDGANTPVEIVGIAIGARRYLAARLRL
jgi:hypothetical protein